MGITVRVREDGPHALTLALRRFRELTRFRNQGPFRWIREASTAKAKKTYYQKPSFIKRMKRVKKKFLAQKRSYCEEGGPPPD
jgi:hypothetical protein